MSIERLSQLLKIRPYPLRACRRLKWLWRAGNRLLLVRNHKLHALLRKRSQKLKWTSFKDPLIKSYSPNLTIDSTATNAKNIWKTSLPWRNIVGNSMGRPRFRSPTKSWSVMMGNIGTRALYARVGRNQCTIWKYTWSWIINQMSFLQRICISTNTFCQPSRVSSKTSRRPNSIRNFLKCEKIGEMYKQDRRFVQAFRMNDLEQRSFPWTNSNTRFCTRSHSKLSRITRSHALVPHSQ